MMFSGRPLLVGAIALAAAAVTLSAETGPLDSPAARAAAAALCGYVDARGHGDFPKVSSLAAADVRWLDTEGRNHPKNDARLKAMVSWEQVMGARWGCRVLEYADGWLEAEVSEENRMYEALGVGTLFQRDRVRVEGGRIREGRTLAEWSSGSKKAGGVRKPLTRPIGRRLRRVEGSARSSATGTLRRQITTASPLSTSSSRAESLAFFMNIDLRAGLAVLAARGGLSGGLRGAWRTGCGLATSGPTT